MQISFSPSGAGWTSLSGASRAWTTRAWARASGFWRENPKAKRLSDKSPVGLQVALASRFTNKRIMATYTHAALTSG